MINGKPEDLGPLLWMVSSKRTGGAIYGFIKGRSGGNRERVGQVPQSMVSWKGQELLSMVLSKDVKEEGKLSTQGTRNTTPRNICGIKGISPVICRLAIWGMRVGINLPLSSISEFSTDLKRIQSLPKAISEDNGRF